MKKIIFGLIATVFMGVSSFGQTIKSSDLEFVGIEHNRLLEKIFSQIDNKNYSKEKKKQVAYQILLDDIKSKNLTNEDEVKVKKILDETFKGTYLKDKDKLYPKEFSNHLSNEVKNLLDELNTVLKTESTSSKEIIQKIKSFENRVSNSNLKDNDLIILYSATNTAKYSVEFWENLVNNNPQNYAALSCCGWLLDLGKADLKGAVGGAVGALIVNVVPVFGQVAYGSTIVVAGAGNSVIAGLDMLF